jgi:hypothetical protein
MSNIEAATARLAFDDILEAVQESRRGRWFLQEYEARLQQRDSKSVLDAINRLEARVNSMATQAPDEIGKVRSAISNARNDLLKLGMGKDAMSEEGRMFAELANMARKAMPGEEQHAGIVRSLKLVEEIEKVVTPGAKPDHGGKFFAADSQLFEKVPVVEKPILVETKKAASTESKPATGAKLVIRKASEPAATVQEEPVVEVAQPVIMQDEPKIADHPRIMIVRKKADDMDEVVAEPAAPSEDSATAA